MRENEEVERSDGKAFMTGRAEGEGTDEEGNRREVNVEVYRLFRPGFV